MKIQIYLVLGLVSRVAQLRVEINAYYYCKGSAVKLFSDTTLNPGESSVSLFRDHSLINQWSANISDDDEKIKEEKSKKRIVRDGNNDIWLHDFEESDSGLYKVLYSLEVNSQTSREKKMNGTLNLCIPPDSDCKPRIQRIEKHGEISLNASLKEKGCGIPPVTAYWHSSDSTNSILEIKSTEGPRSYFACTRGPAMRCLMYDTSHTDFCTEEIIHKTEGLYTDTIRIIYCVIVYVAAVISIVVFVWLLYWLPYIHRLYKDYIKQVFQSTLKENSCEQCKVLLTQSPIKDYSEQGSHSTQKENSFENQDFMIQPPEKKYPGQEEQSIRNRVSK